MSDPVGHTRRRTSQQGSTHVSSRSPSPRCRYAVWHCPEGVELRSSLVTKMRTGPCTSDPHEPGTVVCNDRTPLPAHLAKALSVHQCVQVRRPCSHRDELRLTATEPLLHFSVGSLQCFIRATPSVGVQAVRNAALPPCHGGRVDEPLAPAAVGTAVPNVSKQGHGRALKIRGAFPVFSSPTAAPPPQPAAPAPPTTPAAERVLLQPAVLPCDASMTCTMPFYLCGAAQVRPTGLHTACTLQSCALSHVYRPKPPHAHALSTDGGASLLQSLRVSEKLYAIASAASECLPATDPDFCIVPGGYLLQVSRPGPQLSGSPKASAAVLQR